MTPQILLTLDGAHATRCAFCAHRAELTKFCQLFFEPLTADGAGRLIRLDECREAEMKAKER